MLIPSQSRHASGCIGAESADEKDIRRQQRGSASEARAAFGSAGEGAMPLQKVPLIDAKLVKPITWVTIGAMTES
eukprot:5759203-Amphidinium_carterae.1